MHIFDEQIARDVLTGKIKDLPAPDVIIAVVDATNLERNLYLVDAIARIKNSACRGPDDDRSGRKTKARN